jgi:protein-S-isoprenylcysteine O-methyltransferase Ste14
MADMHDTLRDTAGVIAPPPLIALVTLLLGLALDWLLPAYVLTVLLEFWDRVVIGSLLTAIGVALAIAGKSSFNRIGTNVNPFKPSSVLAIGGIYAYLRNPMYMGLGLILGGLGIAFASDWTLVMLLPAAFLIHFGVVKREERYLDLKFGEAYRAYRRAVPRYGWPRL